MDTEARVNPTANTIVGAGRSISCGGRGPTQDRVGINVLGEKERRERRWQNDSTHGSGLGEAEVSAGRGKSRGCAEL